VEDSKAEDGEGETGAPSVYRRQFFWPAAAEARSGRIRSGDKLVAIFHPPMPCPAATSVAALPGSDGKEMFDILTRRAAAANTPTKANRAIRMCVVDSDVAQVRKLLYGTAGEPVVLEFLRAAECCPCDAALTLANIGKPRNTFTVRLVREAVIDFKGVERSVGVKPIQDMHAERKLQVALDKACSAQLALVEAKKDRTKKRYAAKLHRQEQVVRHAAALRLQVTLTRMCGTHI